MGFLHLLTKVALALCSTCSGSSLELQPMNSTCIDRATESPPYGMGIDQCEQKNVMAAASELASSPEKNVMAAAPDYDDNSQAHNEYAYDSYHKVPYYDENSYYYLRKEESEDTMHSVGEWASW